MIDVFLAEGFEEIEALTPVDVLRRAGREVRTVGVGGRTVSGSHGVPVVCDLVVEEAPREGLEMIVLPGGMPGTKHLEASAEVQSFLGWAVERGLWVGAICAAPSILGHRGLLDGREATCFPSFQRELGGARLSEDYVAVDGRFITGRGMGVALEFSLKLVEALCGRERANEVRESLQCRK